MRVIIAMSTLLALSSMAPAQENSSAPSVGSGPSNEDVRRVEIYGGYSYLNADLNDPFTRQSTNGWDTSVAITAYRFLALEGDVSGYYQNNLLGTGANTSSYLFMAGPRLNFGPAFIHALFGGDRTNDGASLDGSSLIKAAGVGAGVEWRFSRHWGLRPSVDYLFTQHNMLGPTELRATRNNIRAGVGFVYTF